jgi:condensin-2 complex subunit D3
MAKNKRSLLQTAMTSVATNFLSQEKLRKIETHIFTSHKSEAWCILSIIAKRMKSNNPDIVVKTFLDHIDRMEDHTFESNDFHLILEVIQNWTPSFNVNSKTQIVSKISELFEKGKCPISLVHHLYEIFTLTRTILFGKEDMLKFSKKINEFSKKYILDNSLIFLENSGDEKILSFLLLYCETNTDLPRRPDEKLVKFLFEFLRKAVNDKSKMTVESDTPRKMNVLIIVLTRFAMRDNELASDLTPLLAMVLKKSKMHVSCVKTSMQCLNDLCKKHTHTVLPIIKEIIYKLHSENEELRLCALANIFDLVMQDFLKLRGRLLLNFLACLVDKNEIIQLKSQAAILSYAADKNHNLLFGCFLESVFLFNDYVQTDNFGVFPLDEIDRNHLLLYGEDKRCQRFELYTFFVQNIHEMNESHLLMLLKQIIVFKEKLEKKKFKKSSNGVETFKDLLHIFKLICDKRGESKINVSKAENTEYNNDDEGDDIAQTSTATQQKTNKRKQSAITLNDAIPVVEKMILIYPKFVAEILEYDKSLESSTNELTKSIVQNFSTFIEYSNNSFWSEAQSSVKATTSSNKRKKTTRKSAFCGDSSSDESE